VKGELNTYNPHHLGIKWYQLATTFNLQQLIPDEDLSTGLERITGIISKAIIGI